jgi:outer membrane biosynthesis protein TonB
LWEIWWPKALLAGAAGVSFILNVAHAQSGNWPARGVAAIPPAALILGVELLMMVLRRATTIRSARLQAELDKQQLELAALQAPPVPVRGEITRKQRRPRREMPLPGTAEAATEEQQRQPEPRSEPAPEPQRQPQPQPEPRSEPAPEPQRQPQPKPEPERDPNVPIFTPATPARAGDKAARVATARVAAAAAPAKAGSVGSKVAAQAVAADAAHAAEPVFNAARLRAEKRPGALDKNGKPLTPYVVAARILDEHEEKESLTPEALVQALADEGLKVTPATAQELLRELRPPLTSRLTSQRAGGAGGGSSPVDGRRVPNGLAAKAKNR